MRTLSCGRRKFNKNLSFPLLFPYKVYDIMGCKVIIDTPINKGYSTILENQPINININLKSDNIWIRR